MLAAGTLLYQDYNRVPLVAYPSLYWADDAAGHLWRNDVDSGIAKLKAAVRGDTANPFRWCDLGDGLVQAGDLAEAEACFREALRRSPGSPQVILRAANFYYAAGNTAEALRLCSQVLRRVPDFDEAIFSLYLRLGGGTPGIVALGIGGNPRAAAAYVTYVATRGLHEEGARLFREFHPRGWIPPVGALELAHALQRGGQLDQAAEVLSTVTPGFRRANWVFNGDFESPWSDRAFDWTRTESPGLRIGLDPEVAHTGKQSLRLCFTGAPDVEFHPVAQQVALSPGRYEIAASVRTDGLHLREGIRLHIADIADPSRLDLWTEPIGGPGGWASITVSFRIAAVAARLINVEFVRLPSMGFDHRLEGTAWIDAVRITRAAH